MFNYARFEELRASKGVTKKFIADKLGRLPAVCQDWKYGKSSPNADQLKIIAEILDTTPEYLTGKTDEKQKPTDNGELDGDLLKISELVSSLDESRLDAVLEIAQKISVLEKDEVTALLAVIRSMGKK